MKKKIFAVGAASAVVAAMPILGVFAANSSVTDIVTITIDDGCTLKSSTTDTSGGTTPISTTNTYTATMVNGQLKSDIGATGAASAGSNVLSVSCNTDDASKNTWQLTAVGAGGGATVDLMHTDGTGTDIASGTATSGATSNWAMKVTGNGVTIQNGFDAATFKAVPVAATEVATGSGTKTNAFTMTYQVYVSPTQAAGEYTGKVLYTLTNPYSAQP